MCCGRVAAYPRPGAFSVKGPRSACQWSVVGGDTNCDVAAEIRWLGEQWQGLLTSPGAKWRPTWSKLSGFGDPAGLGRRMPAGARAQFPWAPLAKHPGWAMKQAPRASGSSSFRSRRLLALGWELRSPLYSQAARWALGSFRLPSRISSPFSPWPSSTLSLQSLSFPLLRPSPQNYWRRGCRASCGSPDPASALHRA